MALHSLVIDGPKVAVPRVRRQEAWRFCVYWVTGCDGLVTVLDEKVISWWAVRQRL